VKHVSLPLTTVA